MTQRSSGEALESLTHAPAAMPAGVPGKRSLTQSLMPRPLVLRVARDDNGVADHADAAVDQAARGTGEPLRADLRERFESSLGVDLGGVRVHRSADSAAASEAVGARAYTVGNDIHFGAGQYAPDDPFGLHLLAHEVAHTAQQAGAAPTRQHKLAVSAPADAAEVEADRAADAMVAGTAFSVGSAGAGPSALFRDSHTQFKMEPNDAYKQPPYDFSKVEADHDAVVADPEDVSFEHADRAPGFKGLNTAEWSYKESNKDLDPEAVRLRERSFSAYSESLTQLQTTWNAMAPLVTAYQSAVDECGDGGLLGPAPTGQNWDPDVPVGARSYDEVADHQTVGDKTKVGDLFAHDGATGKDTLTGIKQEAVDRGSKEEKVAVSKKFEDTRNADGEVDATITAYQNHIGTELKNTAMGVEQALNAVEIKTGGDDEDKAKAEVERIKAVRAETNEMIKSACGIYDKVGAVTATVAAIAGGDTSVMLKTSATIAEAIMGGRDDAQLTAAQGKLKAASAHLASLKDKSLQLAVDRALLSHDSAFAKIGDFKQKMNAAILKRNRVYDEAAKAAAAKAGGGADGERIKAAINAIPKVATVLGRLDAITGAIVLPPYSPDAGVGLNAAMRQGDAKSASEARWFVTYYGKLKGYQAKYQALRVQWKSRYDQLEALTKKFNVVGS